MPECVARTVKKQFSGMKAKKSDFELDCSLTMKPKRYHIYKSSRR